MLRLVVWNSRMMWMILVLKSWTKLKKNVIETKIMVLDPLTHYTETSHNYLKGGKKF